MSSVGGVKMTICSVLSARARTFLLLGGGALLLLTVNACRTGADYRVDARDQEVRNDLDLLGASLSLLGTVPPLPRFTTLLLGCLQLA